MIPYDNKYRKSHRVLGGDYGYSFTDEEKEVIRKKDYIQLQRNAFKDMGLGKPQLIEWQQ